MKIIYSAPNISLVSIIQTILEGHGIPCWIKNEFLRSGVGELPPIDCWPQLCVRDEDYAEAKRIAEEALSMQEMPPWKCECGELIEGQFTECWQCGKSRLQK